MKQVLVIPALIVAFGTGAFVGNPIQEERSEIEELHKERIDLLRKRKVLVKSLFENDLVDSAGVAESEMDLLAAKIEYAESNAKKIELYEQLLQHMDKMIEIADLEMDEPAAIVGNIRRGVPGKKLFLESEKVRVRIIIAELKIAEQ